MWVCSPHCKTATSCLSCKKPVNKTEGILLTVPVIQEMMEISTDSATWTSQNHIWSDLCPPPCRSNLMSKKPLIFVTVPEKSKDLFTLLLGFKGNTGNHSNTRCLKNEGVLILLHLMRTKWAMQWLKTDLKHRRPASTRCSRRAVCRIVVSYCLFIIKACLSPLCQKHTLHLVVKLNNPIKPSASRACARLMWLYAWTFASKPTVPLSRICLGVCDLSSVSL